MDTWELHKKIDLALNEELRSYAARDRSGGHLGSMNIGLHSEPDGGWTLVGQIPQLLFDKSDPTVISSPNAALLLKLYSSLDPSNKSDFSGYLIGHLRKDSPYTDIAYLLFFVLYRIGQVVDALSGARRALSGDSKHGYSNVLGLLSMIVSREYLEISPKTYREIELALSGDTEHNFQLTEKINLALLKHLEVELGDVNPEVNADRDKILELWGKKFSGPEVPSLVKEIDDSFREGELSDASFATCIGRIRVLLVEVSKRIATGLSVEKTNSSIKEGTDDAYYFQYLKDKRFITDTEWNILRSLYGMASNEGAHRPLSNREYARLTKNMSYELVLLFLSKWEL